MLLKWLCGDAFVRTSPEVKESVGDLRFLRLFPFPSLFFESAFPVPLAAAEATSILSAAGELLYKFKAKYVLLEMN